MGDGVVYYRGISTKNNISLSITKSGVSVDLEYRSFIAGPEGLYGKPHVKLTLIIPPDIKFKEYYNYNGIKIILGLVEMSLITPDNVAVIAPAFTNLILNDGTQLIFQEEI